MKPSRPRRARLVATGLGIAALALSTLDATTQGQPPAGPTGFAEPGSLKFREQQIASDFGVGYAVTAGDVNGDKKPDILAISGTDLVWFAAPDWNKTVILAAGATTADNVTIAPHDIDGDGRHDGALGAGWTRPKDGAWTRVVIGEGSPGEVKLGRVGGRRLLATVEPWHGAGVAVYAEKPGAPLWPKTTIETALTEGHALGWADFDGDGNDELAVGWRRGKPGLAIYSVDREGALKTKQLVDNGGM